MLETEHGEHALAESSGRLSVIATPIGNLEDITLRALATLRDANAILAEDTRQTRKLLTHHGISQKVSALHAHSSDAVIERCLGQLGAGRHLALVTDAGTPLISDPGARLVRGARELGVRVETIPGPSAVTAALSVCGLDFDSFRFMGFAPRSGQKRKAWLEQIAGDEGASVFFESKTRLLATLAELCPLLAEQRPLAVCRELTKIHEQVIRGTATELLRALEGGVRGEITVVVGAGSTRAAQEEETQPTALEPRIEALLARGISARDAARQIARESGLARRLVYARVQALAARRAAGEDG